MIPKQRAIVSKKLRQSAEGKECTMQGPSCNHNPETVCLRHINGLGGGKGIGRKNDDIFSFYGCQHCEDWYALADVPTGTKTEYAHLAMMKTQRIFYDEGLLKVG